MITSNPKFIRISLVFNLKKALLYTSSTSWNQCNELENLTHMPFYLDYEKAFDKVSFKILLSKLTRFDFDEDLVIFSVICLVELR